MDKNEPRKRLDSLTGMRGLACIFIVGFHYFCLFFDDLGRSVKAAPFAPHSAFFFLYGKNAAELFFMISGFLTAYQYRDRIASRSPGDYLRRHYGKLLLPSMAVSLWAMANAGAALGTVEGSGAYVAPVTPLRALLSVLMINTGWFTSYSQTGLPVNSTMWYVNVLLLCYLLYYLLCRLLRNRAAFRAACALMVLLGWICLDHTPRQPFLWSLDGRGYATFFLGALLYEFQDQAGEKVRRAVSAAWMLLILGILALRLAVGFEKIFGQMGGAAYVRYFEFAAAPGLLLGAVNLAPVRKCLEWKPLLRLGMLSGPVYYVHNCVMEDWRILNGALGLRLDFSSGWVFAAVLISILPFACLWQMAGEKWKGRTRSARAR